MAHKDPVRRIEIARSGGVVTAEINRQQAAIRAVDDPVKLAHAARIIRAALARKAITLAELAPPPAPSTQDGES